MKSSDNIFSLMIISADNYMTRPISGLDPCYSEFRSFEIKQVPIIRIFGTNEKGRKCCSHIHGVFPYLYIPYDGDSSSASRITYQIASSIDKAINITLQQANSTTQHVFKVVLVKGIPFYGYHKSEHQFLKIYFYNPVFIKRAASLLQNGAILNRVYQTYESHVPYILQFFIDYNLYGMSFLNISIETVKYRRKNELEDSCVNPEQLLDPLIHRLSVSDIEVDLTASFILNRLAVEKIKKSEHINPGIACIWNDERIRREKINKPIEMPVSQDRLNVPVTESDFMYRQIISEKLKEMTSSDDTILNSTNTFMNTTSAEEVTKRKFNLKSILGNAVYPAECSQELGSLLDASIIQNHIVSSNRTLFSQNFFSSEGETDVNFNLDESIVDETIALSLTQRPTSMNETLNPEDLAFLDVMKLLEDGDDDDSILAPLTQTKQPDSQILLSQKETTIQNVTEIIENENDSDSDDDILNNYSMAMEDAKEEQLSKAKDDEIWENSFWDDVKLPQLDGGHELDTPPRLGRRSRILKVSPKKSPLIGRRTTPRKSPGAVIRAKYQPLNITVISSPALTNGNSSKPENDTPTRLANIIEVDSSDDDVIFIENPKEETITVPESLNKKLPTKDELIEKMISKVKKQLKFAEITVERVRPKKRKSELNIKLVPDKVEIQPTLKKCKVVLDPIKIDEFLIEKNKPEVNLNLSEKFLEIIKKSPVVRLNKTVSRKDVLKSPTKSKSFKELFKTFVPEPSVGAAKFDERCNFFPEPGPSHVNYYESIRIPAYERVEPIDPVEPDDQNQSTDSIDLDFQSFYDKSVLERTCGSERSFHLQLSESDCSMDAPCCDTNCIVITPKFHPPTFNEVQSSLNLFNIPELETKSLFYGNPKDLTGKREIGNSVLRIREKNCVEDFKSCLTDLIGLNDWRRVAVSEMLGVSIEIKPEIKQEAPLIISDVFNEDDNEDELNEKNVFRISNEPLEVMTSSQINLSDNNAIREFLSTEEHLIICPLISAPSQESAKLWFKTKKIERAEKFAMKKLLNKKKVPEIIEIYDDDEEEENSMPCGQKSNPPSSNSQQSKSLLEETVMDYASNSCNISGATLNNTYGFKMDLENLQNANPSSEFNFLTILSIELHVQTRADLKPDPDVDPVTAIFYSIQNNVPADHNLPQSASGVFITDSSEEETKRGFPLLKNSGIPVNVIYAATEKEMFTKFLELIEKWDPDIYAGFEIEMGSWGYLIQRGYTIELNIGPLLSRIPSTKIDFANKFKSENEDRDFNDSGAAVKITGRILLDVWRLLRPELPLTSYTFENVMFHILHRRCALHSHRELTRLWYQSSSRWIVLKYWLERVHGNLQLLDQLDLIGRTCELAKLFGIQFYEVLSRGSQFRVESMMLRMAKPSNLVPLSPSVQQRAHMRAPEYLPLILEPQSKFYFDPMIVLDFQSLYPSVIIAHNYCYSTCLGRVEHVGQNHPFEFGASHLKISQSLFKKLSERDLITVSPCGVVFVKSKVREGTLSRMLKEILETRLMVKQSMKIHKNDKVLQRVLHSRQLGLKLIANVTYGYTAANFSGRMPCIEVGDSVVSKGRETLERAIKMVESNEKWRVKVVYGDTDSLFVLVPGRSREEAFRIGNEIVAAVSNENPEPIKLKLEKVYQPCILQTKKRYVGYMYETPEQKEPIYEAKGIETVRRDGCPAVTKILEKIIRILFETRDVSIVKTFLNRQFTKILTGRINIQDLIFAKEFRGIGGYKPAACVPSLELARKWRVLDRRWEPRTGERVPFIIVNGPPGVPLIKLVRSPHEMLLDEGLKINALYYITKVIIPPVNRCLLLAGADVHQWFAELPRKCQLIPTVATNLMMSKAQNCKKSTISQYFSTSSCATDCGGQTQKGVCSDCLKNPQSTVVILSDKISKLDRKYSAVLKICQSCRGRTNNTNCISLDCPVLFILNRTKREHDQIEYFNKILSDFF